MGRGEVPAGGAAQVPQVPGVPQPRGRGGGQGAGGGGRAGQERHDVLHRGHLVTTQLIEVLSKYRECFTIFGLWFKDSLPTQVLFSD